MNKKIMFSILLSAALLLHVPQVLAADSNNADAKTPPAQTKKIRLSAEQIAKLKVLLAAKQQQQEQLAKEKALQAEQVAIQKEVEKQRELEARKREQRLKEYEAKLQAKRESELKAKKQAELEKALAVQREADRQKELSEKEAIRRRIMEDKNSAAAANPYIRKAGKPLAERRPIHHSNAPVEIDSIEQLNFNYILSSDKIAWSPTLVFDNGEETYLRIPEKHLDDRFAVTGIHSNGDTFTGAYRIQQDFIVVPGIYDHIRIRKGDQTMIVRYKLPDNLGW